MATTYALALPQTRERAPLFGTRAQLALGGGDVEGALAFAGCDRRAGTASYALRVDNQSANSLRARMSCLQSRGDLVLAYPLDVHIAPFSRCETLLPVRLHEIGRYDRALVEISGGDVAFTLEAPAPPRPQRRIGAFLFGALAIVLAVFAGCVAALAPPRIAMLAAPARVFAGSAIDVPYAFGGWASLVYTLRTTDGRQLNAGLLDAHQGTLHFDVPASVGKTVVLAVDVSGPLGDQRRTQRILIAPPVAAPASAAQSRAAAAPRIWSFSLSTPVVRASGDLHVAYATNARAGEIWLIDESGRLWARAPIAAAGTTTLTVPQGAAGLPMRAILHARNGSADALASLAFTVLPSATIAQAQLPLSAPPLKPVAAPAADTLTLSTQSAVPGQTITVTIEGVHGDTAVSLNDASGNSIEQGDIPSSQDAMTLTAPSVTQSTTYYVMANVTQGTSQQTIVRKLNVTP